MILRFLVQINFHLKHFTIILMMHQSALNKFIKFMTPMHKLQIMEFLILTSKIVMNIYNDYFI